MVFRRYDEKAGVCLCYTCLFDTIKDIACSHNLDLARLLGEIEEAAAEYEAIQLYMQLAESTDNKLAIEALKDIADEERVHDGEFLRLLRELAFDEEKFYAEGAQEVEEEIKKRKKARK